MFRKLAALGAALLTTLAFAPTATADWGGPPPELAICPPSTEVQKLRLENLSSRDLAFLELRSVGGAKPQMAPMIKARGGAVEISWRFSPRGIVRPFLNFIYMDGSGAGFEYAFGTKLSSGEEGNVGTKGPLTHSERHDDATNTDVITITDDE